MKGTVPIVTCDSDLGCDEWFLDNYEMGVSNWRDFVPDGWQHDPRNDLEPDLCPEHAPKTDPDPEGTPRT